MAVNVILPLSLSPNRREECESLLKKYDIDLATLLVCALEHWFALEELAPVDVVEVLRPTLDRLLNARGQRLSYEQYIQELTAFRDALYRLFTGVEGILKPLLDTNAPTGKAKMTLKSWLAGGFPVVHIQTDEVAYSP